MPTVPVKNVKVALQTFERAVKRSEDQDGNVDLQVLRGEVHRETKSKVLVKAFTSCIDTLETRYSKHHETTGASCSSRIVTTKPKELTAKQATTVFAALLEATKKGIVKIDDDKDGKITPEESHDAKGTTLSDKLARAAAQALTGAPEPEAPKTRPHVPATVGGGPSCGRIMC